MESLLVQAEVELEELAILLELLGIMLLWNKASMSGSVAEYIQWVNQRKQQAAE